MDEMVKYLVEEGFADYEAERTLANISDGATREEIKRKAMELHLHYKHFEDEEIEELLSDCFDDDSRDEIEERCFVKYMEEQGLTEDEAEMAVSEITSDSYDYDKYSMKVEKIYDSLTDLADWYLETECDSLPDCILNSLDYENLGREVAEERGYVTLDSGRVVTF